MLNLPAELLSAVVASPDDDAPRLACADWLDEHDRADEAEYVRVQVALARTESSRPPGWRARADALAARGRELAAATEAARLGPLRAEFPAGEIFLGFERGFVSSVSVDGMLTPGLLRALAAYPTLGDLKLSSSGESQVGPEDVPLLAALPNLEIVSLELARGGLQWGHIESLSTLPCLIWLMLRHDGEWLLSGPLLERWRQARAERAARIADAVAATRSIVGRLNVAATPAGDLAASAHDHRIPPALVGDLPRLRALWLVAEAAALPRDLSAWAGLRSLCLNLSGRPRLRSREWRALAGLRELIVGNYIRDWTAVERCLRHLPELRSLSLLGSGAAVVPALPELRVLKTEQVEVAGGPWPRLLEWNSPRVEGPLRIDPRQVPELRLMQVELLLAVARPAGGWGATLPDAVPVPDALAAALSAGARRVTVPGEGVSLLVPGWFADAPLPPPDPRTPEVVPLAAWREWGDAGDDLASDPPTRGLLERLDGPLDPRLALSESGLTLYGTVVERTGVTEAGGRWRQEWAGSLAHLWAACVRQVWSCRGRAYRLTWEGGTHRLLSPEAVADFAGDSLECDA